MDTEKLKNRDYVLVLDKSGSMEERDCASGQSRWEAAKESTIAIARKLNELDPDGITVIPFAGSFTVYENTKDDVISKIFKDNSPMGGTVLAPVLQSVFDSYNKAKAAGTSKAGGQIMMVITDGQPSDEDKVARTIAEFTKTLKDGREEFGISFIQVGKDSSAAAFLKRLDDGLVAAGAKYDIVDTKTMTELENTSLTDALMASLTD